MPQRSDVITGTRFAVLCPYDCDFVMNRKQPSGSYRLSITPGRASSVSLTFSADHAVAAFSQCGGLRYLLNTVPGRARTRGERPRPCRQVWVMNTDSGR